MIGRWLAKLFTHAATPVVDTPQSLWEQMLKACPDCGTSPMKLYEGPSGGISTNVFCGACGHGYNITPMLARAEDIGVNLRYCDDGPIKAARVLDQRFNPTTNVRGVD